MNATYIYIYMFVCVSNFFARALEARGNRTMERMGIDGKEIMGGRGGSAWRIYIYIYIYIYMFFRGGSIVRENVYSLHGFPHVHVHEHRLRRGARHAEERIRCGRTNRVCQCDTSSSTEFLSRIECVCCVLCAVVVCTHRWHEKKAKRRRERTMPAVLRYQMRAFCSRHN